MFQFAVVKDCQIPLRSGLPLVVRGISLSGSFDGAWAAAGGVDARPAAATVAAATAIRPLARSLAKPFVPPASR